LDESDCYRVAIEFSIARPDGGDDDEDRVQHPKDGQKSEPDAATTKSPRYHAFFAVFFLIYNLAMLGSNLLRLM